jgi:hypothetical protein
VLNSLRFRPTPYPLEFSATLAAGLTDYAKTLLKLYTEKMERGLERGLMPVSEAQRLEQQRLKALVWGYYRG